MFVIKFDRLAFELHINQREPATGRHHFLIQTIYFPVSQIMRVFRSTSVPFENNCFPFHLSWKVKQTSTREEKPNKMPDDINQLQERLEECKESRDVILSFGSIRGDDGYFMRQTIQPILVKQWGSWLKNAGSNLRKPLLSDTENA